MSELFRAKPPSSSPGRWRASSPSGSIDFSTGWLRWWVLSHFSGLVGLQFNCWLNRFNRSKTVQRDSCRASRVLFQKSSATRTKVETGSDWTNVIIPGEHKSYNNKQVRHRTHHSGWDKLYLNLINFDKIYHPINLKLWICFHRWKFRNIWWFCED